MKVKTYQRLVYEKGELTLSSPLGPAMWLRAYEEKTDQKLNLELALAYLSGQTITQCWELIENQRNRRELNNLADWFVSMFRTIPLEDLVNGLRNRTYTLVECVANIPQISSYDASTLKLLDLLDMADKSMTYSEIGYHLYVTDKRRTDVARKKYGENAAKFAAVLGLVEIARGFDGEKSSVMLVRLTDIGRAVQRVKGDRSDILVRLFFKLALFRDLVCSDVKSCFDVFKNTIDMLSVKTRRRRASAFSCMLKVYFEQGGTLMDNSQAEVLQCHMRR